MAKPIPNMPNEVLDHILGFSSYGELWQARQVSREFYEISIAHIFRCVHLYANDEKVGKFHSLLATKVWANSVRKLVVIGPKPNTDTSKHEFSMSKIMRDVLRDLPKLEHLSSLCINFHSSSRFRSSISRERITAFRTNLLASVLTPLIDSPSTKIRIERLSITPLQSYADPSLTSSVGFVNLLGNILALKLRTQMEPALYTPTDGIILSKQSIEFYTKLPDTWLLPAAQTLKFLYLSADLRWGWYPKVDFRHIHFPHLQSLTLEAFCFSNDWQLEWLLSHGGSLRRLGLIDCSILAFAKASFRFLDSDGYLVIADDNTNVEVRREYRFGGRWCHYFRAFATSLPLLQMFSLQADFELLYADFENEYEPTVQVEELVCLRDKFDYNAYTSKRLPRYFHSETGFLDDPKSPIHWQEREQAQHAEDEKALFELLDAIERRNTVES